MPDNLGMIYGINLELSEEEYNTLIRSFTAACTRHPNSELAQEAEKLKKKIQSTITFRSSWDANGSPV